jgi:hypothetical protein
MGPVAAEDSIAKPSEKHEESFLTIGWDPALFRDIVEFVFQ